MKKVAIFLLFLLPLSALAQGNDLLLDYHNESGSALPLYRGRLATKYSFSYNGVYTWDRAGFREGDLVYEGKLYKGLQMDINAHSQTLLVHVPESFSVVDLGSDGVDSFSLGNTVYRNLSAKGINVPKGFYKVVYEGKECIYERIDKEFRRDINSKNDGSIGYKDPNFKEGVFEIFVQHRAFYHVDANGKAKKFSSLKALLKKHKDLRREVTNYE